MLRWRNLSLLLNLYSKHVQRDLDWKSPRLCRLNKCEVLNQSSYINYSFVLPYLYLFLSLKKGKNCLPKFSIDPLIVSLHWFNQSIWLLVNCTINYRYTQFISMLCNKKKNAKRHITLFYYTTTKYYLNFSLEMFK